ncbi:platelet endothelial cell adhesion molecule isoform X2 [Hoplias malabaricus]|uniref:platelet endothelial cell adhesion molecule isoform X2 n=1 Tax=Hoplias malabaricus TaxID=27720 RepID=UPI00346192C2
MWATHTCLLLLLIFTSNEAQSVLFKSLTLSVEPAEEVERGTNLTLTCDAKVSVSGGYRPKYSYIFYKDFKMLQMIQNEATAPGMTPGILYIPHSRAFHSGKYKCEVNVEEKGTSSNTVNVVVKGLQTPQLSVDRNVVMEGEGVRATCRAEEEQGSLTFSLKDGEEELYRDEASKGSVEKMVSLKPGRTATLSCSYYINVADGRLESNSSNVVSVDVKELDILPFIKIQPSPEVIEGDTVNISCGVNTSLGNSSSLSLQLAKDLKILKLNMKLTPYSKVVLASDAGEYECNSEMDNVQKTTSANLSVRELFSRPILTISPSEEFEMQPFTVRCTSSHYVSERISRDDVKYSVYRDGNLLTPGAFDGAYTDTTGNRTNGNYTCIAQVENITKHSQSHSFRAKVLVSTPRIQVTGKVVLGRPFQIHCFSDRGTFPITYRLLRNQNLLNHSQVSHPGEEAIFSSVISSEKQIQEFSCEAQNSPHTSPLLSKALNATVIVPVENSFLTVVPSPDDVTEGQDVFLICSIMKGTPPISFSWYSSDKDSPLNSSSVISNYSTHILYSVSGEHSGSYYCKAMNEGKETGNSNVISFTVRMARWKKSLIGGVCFVFVAVLVVVLVIYYRSMRGRVAYLDTRTNGPQNMINVTSFPVDYATCSMLDDAQREEENETTAKSIFKQLHDTSENI